MTDDLRRLVAIDAVARVVNAVFVGTDRRDWEAVRACFAPRVHFDMSSVGGGPAAPTTPEAIVDGWRSGLSRIAALHHQVGNLETELGDGEASASCYGIAFHYRPTPSGRNTRTFVGSYEIHLVASGPGWKIDRFRFNLKFQDGNVDLEKD